MQDAANSGAAASGAEAQEQPAAAGAAPETAAWDPMRFLPSTLVEMDDGNGAEADSGPLMPLDRKVSCSADFPIHGRLSHLKVISGPQGIHCLPVACADSVVSSPYHAKAVFMCSMAQLCLFLPFTWPGDLEVLQEVLTQARQLQSFVTEFEDLS